MKTSTGKIIGYMIIPCVICLFAGSAFRYYYLSPKADREMLTQISTIDAVLIGVYDGFETVAQLKLFGDLGIGTFDGLEGEMVMINGRVFKIRDDGNAYEASDNETSPFASVTYFDPDVTANLPGNMDINSFSIFLILPVQH